jgi:hypothetical protein
VSEPARWISVGELADAFDADNFTPPTTADLAGTAHVLHFADGSATEYRFLPESRLSWKAAGGEAGGAAGPGAGEAPYFAVTPRAGIYFVDFVVEDAPPAAISLVLDLGRGIATRLTARLPESADVGESLMARAARGDELTAVTADFAAAAVDAPFTATTPRHEETADLVGRRVEYTYSATERYEHIYLNEHFYTWHCLLGSEKGLADTDRCHYLKLGEDLYLFVWREKIVPTLGAVVVDFRAMRTMGKIFGHAQGGTGGTVAQAANFPVGARARLLNITLGHPDIAP